MVGPVIEARDLSRAVHVSCLCACGTFSRARRWLRVDLDAREDLVQRVRKDGSVEGTCGQCGSALRGKAIWLEVSRARAMARLCVPSDRGAEVLAALREQLEGEDEIESFPSWMLRPEIVIAPAVSAGAGRHGSGEYTAVEMRPAVEVAVPPLGSGVPRAVDVSAPRAASPLPPNRERPTTVRTKAPVAVSDEEDDYTPPRGIASEALRLAQQAKALQTEDEVRRRATPVEPSVGAPDGPDSSPTKIDFREEPEQPGRLDGATMLGKLVWRDGRVELRATVDAQLRRVWAQASLRARPVLIRDAMYPLLGVRVLGSYLGESGLIDGLIDVARDEALDIWRALATNFEVTLVLESEGSALEERRQLGATGLERNAAACLDSARALLAGGEFLPDAYETAIAAFCSLNYADRVRPSAVALSGDDFRHVISSEEAKSAIARLDLATQPENVAALIELEGLPMSEFEDVRKRVLEASLEFGLLAPRRFWRRMIGSGLATSDDDYVAKLCAARAQCIADGDELDPVSTQRAWEEIAEFCRAKDLAFPQALRAALGLEEQARESGGTATPSQLPPVPRPATEPTSADVAASQVVASTADQDAPATTAEPTPSALGAAAGEGAEMTAPDSDEGGKTVVAAAPLGPGGEGASLSGPAAARMARQRARRAANQPRAASGEIRRSDPRLVAALGDPRTRARAAKAALERRLGVDEVCSVLAAMSVEEMIGIAGPLSAVSRRATESLLSQLRASSRELRQFAAVVLGEGGDPGALDPLVELLTRERTEAWLDVARAVASFGADGLAAVQDLCPSIANEQIKLERVARALAEMMRRDETGDLQRTLTSKRADGRPGTEVEEYDPAFAKAISLAVATLPDMVAEHERLESLYSAGKLSPPREFSWRLGVAIHGAEGFDAVHTVEAELEDDEVAQAIDEDEEFEEFEELDEIVELSENSVRAAGLLSTSGAGADNRRAAPSNAGAE